MRFMVLALLVGLCLAGCGRKGAPNPPGPPSAVTYPHTYPSE
jgi:predicted small lipoprotein YifL